ncbi:MAG: ABC-ATPase domain-containing protein [Candidatus Nitronauta litoralis]|uniref:ABC-ATPase domain-containing protein n=1 Tax=Candidatus Nitronauta litoralis TaxID=2705533 RepID=A0A7T0BZ78_9BACT|nr:MAG: ABC-ATPase domain-containing protein [Candidatus Nitronauta litoralis]
MNIEAPETLKQRLTRVEGRGYKAYKDLQGTDWAFGPIQLKFEHVQGDAFAEPSRMTANLPFKLSGLPDAVCDTALSRIAVEDFLLRRFHKAVLTRKIKPKGAGKSGIITALFPSQKIIKRSAVTVSKNQIELVFFVGLPAEGRRILGLECWRLFEEDVAGILRQSLAAETLDMPALKLHTETFEDFHCLQGLLNEKGWVGFVTDGSCLARAAGNSDLPLKECQSFIAPEKLSDRVTLPNAGEIRGMPILKGIMLLVGGGFHGKSTLLKALQNAVYPHIPGDGREQVAVNPTAVKVRAEDGRFVNKVDISPFLDNLPGIESTETFSTQNASGSTSQAVNIVESLQSGCKLLLLDEDTCATNFMIRDARMQALIHKEQEPITPFIDRVRELYERFNISAVLVMGGSGDYFDVADTVVAMENFQPHLVSEEARKIAVAMPTGRNRETPMPFPDLIPGRHSPENLKFRKGKREVFISSRGCDSLLLGINEIDTHEIEQLVETGQLEACGWILHALKEWLEKNEGSSVAGVKSLLSKMENNVSCLLPWNNGLVSLPRLHEVMAVLSRMRF